MPDSEYFALMVEYNIAAMTAMGMYITVASGYLIAAFLIGRQLTTLQAAIITVMFSWFAAFMAMGTAGYFDRAKYFYDSLEVQPPGLAMNSAIIIVAVSFELLGILVCLKFMWDIRHPKKE
jgi:hypothetical protein